MLSQKEVESVMSTLNDEQIYFLQYRTKQRKKSRWLQTLATYKGLDIDEKMSEQEIEEMLEDWVLVDIKDGGYQKRPYKCDCGQALRFQYIIQNKKECAIRSLGENCFENYLQLPPAIIKDIKKGMYLIDLERDEILVKYKKKLYYPLQSFLHLAIPQDFIDQHEVGLPLTDNQIATVERLHKQYEEEKKLASLFLRLTIEQQQFISKWSQEDRRELLLMIEEGHAECLFQTDEASIYHPFIKRQMELKLPLLEKQKQQLNESQMKQKRAKQFHALTVEQQQFLLTFDHEDQAALLDRIHKPLYYNHQSIEHLPLDARIKKQVELQLPLLKEQIYEIQVALNRVVT
ncbi:hypothetical protein [Halalkalibacter krulwichiae]|uniref:Uncharacterized protein n=1 Tax=Halalkalibacter krulwichiae TaxID=199441 RepID=A0A1X9MJ61_9BACI|nr:hypothetical protein [Halalkalibacter krulwichiae]ARK32333.1 hypothetical protein BkAM31D_22115 [Halalkalibacter krulwichiae]